MYRGFMVTVTVYGSVIDSGELLCDGVTDFHELVLDDCEEIRVKKDTRTPLGRILLKGDNISLMMQAPGSSSM